ncbi:MAG: hypothetical protein MZV70_11115 [Desulfobacterales bacterium]|nr:hypothetical protein [Desulfobacterales bacterium]
MEIDAGYYHATAVSSNGSVFTWGFTIMLANWESIQPPTAMFPYRLPVDFRYHRTIKWFISRSGSTILQRSPKPVRSTLGARIGFGQLGDNTTNQKLVPTVLESVSTPATIKLSFNSNGGSAVSDIDELEGTSISAPTAPTKSGIRLRDGTAMLG